MKICHVTSAHDSDDFRIFKSECCSLAKKGHEVFLVAPGESREECEVHVVGVGDKPKSRKDRMTSFSRKIVDTAIGLNCDVYHLHDPELMRFIPRISKKGKKVIFDSHEDYRLLMLAKAWIPKALRPIVSVLYTGFEWYVCRYLNGYIACYHWTKQRVEKWIPNTKLVFNYPPWEPISNKKNISSDLMLFCYAGGISNQWMHKEAIKAVSEITNSKYLLAGSIDDDYGVSLQMMDEWKNVDYIGRIEHAELPQRMYAKSIAGVCLLDYIPQCKGHIGNLSNTKLFEYMLNGLPVICTDFDLWKGVVEQYNCGICVNPHNIEQIAQAMRWMTNNIDEAIEMGIRGNNAIKEKYNWDNTSEGLFEVYNKL